MGVPYARDPGELMYTETLNKLYQEFQSRHPPVFGLAHCCFAALYDYFQFLRYLKLWRAAIKFEYKNRTGKQGPSFLGWHNREFYAGPKEMRLCFYVGVPQWWDDYKPCWELEVPTCPMVVCSDREFADGWEAS